MCDIGKVQKIHINIPLPIPLKKTSVPINPVHVPEYEPAIRKTTPNTQPDTKRS